MALELFKQQSSNKFSRIKDLRYVFTLATGAGMSALLHLMKKDAEEEQETTNAADETESLRKEREAKIKAAKRTKAIFNRNADIAADTMMYGLMTLTTTINLQGIKEEVTEIFRSTVSQELNIPPEKVNYSDLGKSRNFFVQQAYHESRRFGFWNRITDSVFVLGAVFPAVEDVWRHFTGRQIKEGKKPFIAAGKGMEAGIAATSAFYISELFRKPSGSYNYIQQLYKLMGEPDKQSGARAIASDLQETEGANLLMDLYNHYYTDFRKKNPTLYPEDKQTFTKQPIRWLRSKINTLFGRSKDEEVTQHVLPKQITNADRYTQGTFTYLSELLTRTGKSSSFAEQGSDMNFGLPEFLMLLDKGWVSVDYPVLTQYVARIIGIEGAAGFARIDAMLVEKGISLNHIRFAPPQEGGVTDPLAVKTEAALRQLYTDVVREKLQAEKPKIADMLTIHVKNNGESYDRPLNAVLAAEVIGPKRLRHYLFLEQKNLQGEESISEITMDLRELEIGLLWKITQRLEKEDQPNYMLRDVPLKKPGTPKEIETILSNIVPGFQLNLLAPRVGEGLAPQYQQSQPSNNIGSLIQTSQAEGTNISGHTATAEQKIITLPLQETVQQRATPAA